MFGQIAINGTKTHASHSLTVSDGIFLSHKCGLKAQHKVRKLAKPCTNKRTVYSESVVKRAKAGTLSRGLASSSTGPSSSHLGSSPCLSVEESRAFHGVQYACNSMANKQQRDDPDGVDEAGLLDSPMSPHLVPVPGADELSGSESD